jgi:RimJ/RimL family protein N-acetyltransferase
MIRAIGENDIDAYVALRRRSLLDAPLALTASPEDDHAVNPKLLREQMRRAPDWMLFGAFDPELAGAAGLARDRHRKRAHIATLWGFWVAPEHRASGLGGALLDAVIAHARAICLSSIHLSVSSAAPDALRLYERAGFVLWGVEPDALRYDEQSYDEQHMVLRL